MVLGWVSASRSQVRNIVPARIHFTHVVLRLGFGGLLGGILPQAVYVSCACAHQTTRHTDRRSVTHDIFHMVEAVAVRRALCLVRNPVFLHHTFHVIKKEKDGLVIASRTLHRLLLWSGPVNKIGFDAPHRALLSVNTHAAVMQHCLSYAKLQLTNTGESGVKRTLLNTYYACSGVPKAVIGKLVS